MSREGADAVAALELNAAFYDAFARSDLEAMDAIWSRDEAVSCTHPGGRTLQGRVAVMGSWQNLFSGGSLDIRYSGDSATLVRGLAFVNCLEHIEDKTLVATNILVWESGSWRFVCHVAGVISEAAPLRGAPSGVLH